MNKTNTLYHIYRVISKTTRGKWNLLVMTQEGSIAGTLTNYTGICGIHPAFSKMTVEKVTGVTNFIATLDTPIPNVFSRAELAAMQGFEPAYGNIWAKAKKKGNKVIGYELATLDRAN